MPDPYLYRQIAHDRLDPGLRAGLDAVLDAHGEQWVIAGPCPDGGWYAWPRADATGPRVLAAGLAELNLRLKEASR